ncbi:cadherin-like domain-containing protein, partial [Oleiphilus sp. HI0125]
MDEDSVITITSDQLLANSYDIEIGVRLEEVTYTGSDGIFQAHQDSEGQPYFTFAPNQNFNGEIVLGVTISDGELTDTTTASIDVLPINDPPVVGDLAYAINEDESITLSQEQLLVQASDIEGDDLVAVNLQSIDGNVSITANTDGSFTLTPNSDLNGAFDISFGVFDGEATVAANIDLTVNPVNDLPVAQDQNFQMNEDGTITLTDGDLLTGASDVDGDTLSISDVAYT